MVNPPYGGGQRRLHPSFLAAVAIPLRALVAAAAVAITACAAPSMGASAGGCTLEADSRFDLVTGAAKSGDAQTGSATAYGIRDLTLRARMSGLALGARAVRSGSTGESLGQPVCFVRWTRSTDTEVLAGLLRIHLGAGCVVSDGDWDELDAARSYSSRLLQVAPTLSRSTPARTGVMTRLAFGGWRVAAWAVRRAGPGTSLAEAGEDDFALDPRAVCLEGVAVGTQALMLAAIRTGASPSASWAWSATTALRDGARSGVVIEIAGSLPALRRQVRDSGSPAPAWEGASRTWSRALAGHFAAMGGRWHVSARPLIGDLDGAFRLLAGVSRAQTVSPAGEAGASPAPQRFGWRCTWRLPALAGVEPAVSLCALQPADGDTGPGALERAARLDLSAHPWSGAALRLGLDARTEDLLRSVTGGAQTQDPIRSSSNGIDLEARLALAEQASCILRYRQRGASQVLDSARAPRLREILEESEIAQEGASPAQAPGEPAWLRERSGSVLWFRLAWAGAGPRRAGIGLAAAPRDARIPALVPARCVPGRTSWRPLAAGAHLVEAWYGLQSGALDLEAAVRWCAPAPGSPSDLTLALGVGWRGRLAGPAAAH
jgi:hypothetical protein